MIRVGIVDDQRLVREGIAALLVDAPDITVVFDAADGEQALALTRQHAPHVLLLDIRMPVMDGIGVLRELRSLDVPTRALVLTTFDDDEALIQAAALGARGYLLKDVSVEDLVGAIRTVAAGGTAVRPAMNTRIADALRRPGAGVPRRDVTSPARLAPRGGIELTTRELEVLRLLAGGLSNREIASAMQLAEGTVKNHVSVILDKLGVRDRTRAVLRAIEEGLV
mgnify:CR=1 FL=1